MQYLLHDGRLVVESHWSEARTFVLRKVRRTCHYGVLGQDSKRVQVSDSASW